MEDVSRLVARQYEAFAYPQPADDLDRLVARGSIYRGDPSLYGPILWPHGRPTGRLRILIAGCGTIQAAYAAYMNRADEVVGIDLSETSLGHERFLQEQHGLDNLKLYRGDLLEVAELGARFDVIICSGVLHHMADPAAGLSALRDVLVPDGVMVLMVYGQAARVGVYMLQDVFRRLGLQPDNDGIGKVRSVLAELPQIIALSRTFSSPRSSSTIPHSSTRSCIPKIVPILFRRSLTFSNPPIWSFRIGSTAPNIGATSLGGRTAQSQL